MTVSVCIPVFNSAAYIRECLESVLQERRLKLEVVVSDNASDDGTWEIIQGFRDSRLRTFRSSENVGMAENFNRALAQCKGRYIKLLCADDVLQPDSLKLQSAFLDQHPDLTMTTGATQIVDSKGKNLGLVRWFERPVLIDASELRTIALIYGNIVGEPSAVLFRKDSWLRAGPFRDGLVTLIDLDMWFRLTLYGGLGYLPEPICCIRRHASSMTNQFRAAGAVQQAVLSMTQDLLADLKPTWLARKVSLGKVSASHIRHALFGFRQGALNWPLSSVYKALEIDPGLVGSILYLGLFRSGLMGLKLGNDGRLGICGTGTLELASEMP